MGAVSRPHDMVSSCPGYHCGFWRLGSLERTCIRDTIDLNFHRYLPVLTQIIVYCEKEKVV